MKRYDKVVISPNNPQYWRTDWKPPTISLHKKKAWISLINMENQAYSGRGSVQAFLTTLILAFCAVGWESESKGSAIVLILEAANNFCLQHHCLAL